MPASELLEPCRCPQGCDTAFLSYLYWEDDPEVRIVTLHRMGVEKKWDLGLRCGDCARRWLARDVPDVSKLALDDEIRTSLADMIEMDEQLTKEQDAQ